MAFREKITWLTLIAMVIAYSVYFGKVAEHGDDIPLISTLWLFGTVTVIQLIVVIIGSIILAATAARDAHKRADERDRAISRRGAAISYYVLMAGMIYIGLVLPFSFSGVKILNMTLIALVAAEFVRLSVMLLSYRRGWHG